MWVLATNALARGITDTGIAVGAAATLALGAYRVVDGETSLAVLLTILMIGVEVFRPLRDMRALLHEGMVGQSAARGLFRILDARPPVADEATTADPVGDLAPTIDFDDVTFAYPGARGPAHRELSFSVAAGERVAVVGASGAGKSSILKLLMRLYDPQSGRVRFGGRDLRTLPFATLRRQLAVVSQDPHLFHGTVADNLRFGKPDASQDEIEAAARTANAHEFISRLPQGYDTVVGERGVRLSGGQRQRVAIARALLRDAPILVLDEALSAVDAENEAVIREALVRLMRGRTTLIFAHRLSSVIDADRILVLDGGRVVESGDHAALMARGGVYHALMAAQAGGGDDRIAGMTGGAGKADGEEVVADLPGRVVASAPTDAILRAEGLGWPRVLALLFRLVAPWKGKLALTFGFGVARVVAFIGVGVASALVVAAIKTGASFDTALIVLAVLAPLAGILHWLESWIAHDMAFRLLAEMRVALFNQLDRLAPAYLLRRRGGDLVGLATHDVERVEYFFAHTVAPAFVAVLVPVVVLATLYVYGPALAAVLAPFLIVIAAGPILFRRRVDRLGARSSEGLALLNAHAVETVQGLTEIVAFDQAARRWAEFRDLMARHRRQRLPFLAELARQEALLEVATGLGGLAVVIAGAVLVAEGALSSALLPMLTLLAMAAFLPVFEIAHVGRQLADTLASTRRLHAVHSEPVPVTDGPGVPAVAAGAGGLVLDGVGFTYPETATPAVDGVGFAVEAGRTVAIVGRSGADKTTLAHLLLRFWDPDRGVVRLDGHDLAQYRLDALRARIALVAQDTYLFNDGLGANIRLARPDASAEDLRVALRHAALEDFVAGLPEGLDTRVGERGMQLSGGQRQRVAIARAFLKDAPVLILDEATSHLDAISERAVHRALETLMSDRTTVVIAHRLSTVRSADLIVVLDRGRVVESGDHATLIAQGGLYARLVAHQIAIAAD